MFTRDSKILSHRLTTPLTAVANAVGDVFKPTYNQIIKYLFANNEQGFAYDPNDLTTMWQDAAGTIPVTGAGQPVGLMLDKGKGLVLGSELITNGDFSDGTAGWTLRAGTAYSVTNGALTITNTTAAEGYAETPTAVVAGKWYKLTLNVLSASRAYSGSAIVGGKRNSLIGVGSKSIIFLAVSNSTLAIGTNSAISGDNITIDNVSVKEIQGNHAYQTTSASRPILRKNAVTGAYYLEFDGSDDFLQTNNIDFTATDKVSLFAGVRKLSDAATSILAELSTSAAANAGAFIVYAPPGTAEVYGTASRGISTSPSYALVSNNLYKAPNSAVLSISLSTTQPLTKISLDGKSQRIDTGNQGGGNYGNYPLYIGRRGGTSAPFNGHIYSLIGIGRLTTDAETAALEKLIAKNTGVTLS